MKFILNYSDKAFSIRKINTRILVIFRERWKNCQEIREYLKNRQQKVMRECDVLD